MCVYVLYATENEKKNRTCEFPVFILNKQIFSTTTTTHTQRYVRQSVLMPLNTTNVYLNASISIPIYNQSILDRQATFQDMCAYMYLKFILTKKKVFN